MTRAATKGTTPEARLRKDVREMIDEVARPAITACVSLLDASSELEDDAELGRRAREIVRTWARARVDAELRRRPPLTVVQ